MNDKEVIAATDAKMRAAAMLADGIRQYRYLKAMRPLTEGEDQLLQNKVRMAQIVLGMSGSYDELEVLDGLEKYILNLEETRPR